MKVGFIGTGSMGSVLIKSLIRSGALNACEIMASNRNISKVNLLAEQFPGLEAVPSNRTVVQESQIVFICVKPMEFKQVIDEIKDDVLPSQIVVSITSPVLIEHLERQLDCKIAKIIPSVTNFALGGATLCIYGKNITPQERNRLETLLGYISRPIPLSEQFTRIASDLSSCGPAFLAFFLEKFIDAAVSETGIERETATMLASEMLFGTGKLLTAYGFTPENLQQRVAVPGGITAEGLRLMEEELGSLFHKLIRATHDKYEEDLQKVQRLFFDTDRET